MEIMHPHLRLAAGLIMTAGLVSACSGGSSGARAPELPPPAAVPTTTSTDLMGEPSDCTAASDNCIITTRTGETVTEVRRIETAMNRKTVTVTVNGTMRTVTVTSTASGTGAPSGPLSVEMLTRTAGEDWVRTSLTATMYREDGSVMTVTVTAADGTMTATDYAADGTTVVSTRVTAMNGTVTETTNMADADAMTNTETVTVSGTTRTITVTSTNPAHNNRVMSVEEQTRTAGEDWVRTSRREVVYAMDGTVTSDVTMRYDVNGRLVRTVTGTGEMASDTFRLTLSGSNGGRTETTVTAAGRKVQKFRQLEGGDPIETVFTAAGATATDSTVTRTVDAMRTQTVTEGGDVTTVTTGMPKSMSDTEFMGTITIVTNHPGARALVSETRTKTAGAAGDGTLTHRTYVRAREASGMRRETRRETLSVSPGVDGADGADGSRTQSIATAYASSGAKTVTTTDYGAGGVADKTTVMVTAADGKETTTVRASDETTGAFLTMKVEDGMTVVTTYGAGYTRPDGADDDAPAMNQKFTVVTSDDGTVTTTVTTGTGDDEMTVRIVKTDELGVETDREVFSNAALTRKTTTTRYTATGTTVTTLTETRAMATATTWTESTTADNTVVMKDRMNRETSRVTTTGLTRTRVTTVYTETGNTKTTVTETRTAATSTDWKQSSSVVDTTVDKADGTSEVRTVSSGGTGDLVPDIKLVTMAKLAAGQTERAITRDIVMHPGVQSHAIVDTPDYDKIVAGLGKATPAGTVMGQAILHLNYAEKDAAFATLADDSSGSGAVEVELVTTHPTCAATGGCTYNDLLHDDAGVGPNGIPEVRIGGTEVMDGDSNGYVASLGTTAGDAGGWEASETSRTSKVVMHRLLAHLLEASGAGAAAEYMPPTPDSTLADPDATPPVEASGDGYVAAGPSASGETPVVTGPKVVVSNVAPTADERKTFTYLKEAGLPDRVLGIGHQEKRVDSYTPALLGGVRGDTPNPVKVKVENYFGWMENSMFTVRRVTAQGVTGAQYDWVSGTETPGPTGEVRAYFGMASGTPTGHTPRERRNEGMTDPGTWTGTMIGVGSIQGERYRGRAKVKVDFTDNGVTTTFDQINIATDSDVDRSTANLDRAQYVANELKDAAGIVFESDSIIGDGSYTSSTLTGGVADDNETSSLTARFYGADAAEVAGTFNAYGLALGYPDTTAEDALTLNRGDLVGAFGAARDPEKAAAGN